MSAISVLLVLLGFFVRQCPSEQALRKYVMTKDLINGWKAAEFSIYDRSETNLLYRIESSYAWRHSLQVYAYPGEKMVASLTETWSLLGYNADIRVYDTSKKQWIDGTIAESLMSLLDRFNIQYGNRRLTMRKKFFSSTMEICHDRKSNHVLARSRKRILSFSWWDKYDLQVYSNEIPNIIYFLAVAVYDHQQKAPSKSNKKNKD